MLYATVRPELYEIVAVVVATAIFIWSMADARTIGEWTTGVVLVLLGWAIWLWSRKFESVEMEVQLRRLLHQTSGDKATGTETLRRVRTLPYFRVSVLRCFRDRIFCGLGRQAQSE